MRKPYWWRMCETRGLCARGGRGPRVDWLGMREGDRRASFSKDRLFFRAWIDSPSFCLILVLPSERGGAMLRKRGRDRRKISERRGIRWQGVLTPCAAVRIFRGHKSRPKAKRSNQKRKEGVRLITYLREHPGAQSSKVEGRAPEVQHFKI